MPLVNINGTAIYYEERGTGLPLVVIHGLGVTHKIWEPQTCADARGSTSCWPGSCAR